MYTIRKASKKDTKVLVSLIKSANENVAKQFGINQKNNPKHPSFYTEEWLISDLERGEEYFIYENDSIAVGCVAYESSKVDTAYLNRLSVLPTHQKKGIGEALVNYIFEYSKNKEHEQVSIGIIASHLALKNWYLKLGFYEKTTKSFEHLPFDVTYMSFRL